MQHVFKFEENDLVEEVSIWEHSDSDKGQIYTRPEVVDFMLTAIGLNDNEDLINARILEPSCGEGEFVIAIAERLIKNSKVKPTIDQLIGKVLAIDLVGESIEIAKSKVYELLLTYDYTAEESKYLIDNWFLTADFLLKDVGSDFTHVIGNPPYVRVENIPKGLLCEYRRIYSTMTDRADLYIPFFEKSLLSLLDGGKLSFICTDRWTKNTYGRALREFISQGYSLEVFIDLYGINAFEQDVMTYPAITQIRKSEGNKTILMNEILFTQEKAKDLLKSITGISPSEQVRKDIVNGTAPWLVSSSDEISIIHKIERKFPILEEAKCKVFIGAATGANKVYIVDKNSVDIEESRLLPVVTASELKSGSIQWSGKYLVNTYDENGIVNLYDYPKLANYLIRNKENLSKRHVASKDPKNWFKTIDRVYEERSKFQKLLIPDISSEPIVIYDNGIFHPNNSIYYICSKEWNLYALRVVLLSNVTKIFFSAYSTKIAKGYLRFQAQHLRKLRLPIWSSIDDNLKVKMIKAGKANKTSSFTALTCEMYGLNKKEKLIVGD